MCGTVILSVLKEEVNAPDLTWTRVLRGHLIVPLPVQEDAARSNRGPSPQAQPQAITTFPVWQAPSPRVGLGPSDVGQYPPHSLQRIASGSGAQTGTNVVPGPTKW